MRSVIITGATGFIGSYVLKEYLEKGADVYVVVRDPSRLKLSSADLSMIHIITDTAGRISPDLFPEEKYDTFIHLAWGGVNRDDIDDESIHKANYEYAVSAYETAKQLGCRVFLDSGSRAEYGRLSGPCREDMPSEPYDAYGRWKVAFYKYAYGGYREAGSMNYIHVRLFSVIGVGDHPWSVIASSCRAFKAGEPMEYGACTQMWNFMSADDCAACIRLLAENADSLPPEDDHIVNVASRDTRPLRSFIEEIHDLAGSNSVMTFGSARSSVSIEPDITKLRNITGWDHDTDFREVIGMILQTKRETCI
ncbi:Nucleoside-diphosphate-sugar epimerase [Lachnospiraceae bacterium XBB2008]|nr:Nucleoside-diphosphate-sugar epimerase [Lachnospiraceae bacterium XBB2008]